MEEVNRRGGMKTLVKEELKNDLTLRLLEENERGRLMPSLMESLGAELFVYSRREQDLEVERGLGDDEQGLEIEEDSEVKQGSEVYGQASGDEQVEHGSEVEHRSEVDHGLESEVEQRPGVFQESEIE